MSETRLSMRQFAGKWIATPVRFAVCGLALWWAFGSVSIYDTVILRADHAAVKGAVREVDGQMVVHTRDGSVRYIAAGDIARDSDGAPRVSYGLLSVWRRADALLLACSVACFFVVPFLQGVRLRWLLGCQQIRLGLWPAVKLSFAGNFLNFAAPLGSTAGDVFKAYYASMHTNRKTEAATSVFLDRAIGLGTLLLSVTFIAMWAASTSRLAPLRGYLFVLACVPVVGCLLYLSPFVRRSRRIRTLCARLPRADQLRRIDSTARTLIAQKSILVRSVMVTVVLQIFAAATFLCLALALGLRLGGGDLLDVYAYFSAGEIVKAIPGPPQGLGTAELAYGYFFAGFGSASQIVSAAIGVRVVNLLCALPGLAIVISGAYRPGTARERSGDFSHTVPAAARAIDRYLDIRALSQSDGAVRVIPQKIAR